MVHPDGAGIAPVANRVVLGPGPDQDHFFGPRALEQNPRLLLILARLRDEDVGHRPLPKYDPIHTTSAPARYGRRTAGRTLKEAAAPVMLYLDPAALKALKRYALDQNTKVHSLLLDAVETWFKSHGLRQPVRVQTTRQQSQGGEA